MGHEFLIVDDHPLFRAALRGAVAAACTDGQFFEADTIANLLELVEQHPQADLLLLDLNMPGAHGFSALAHLRGTHPQMPVIVVSAMDDARTVRQALAFGAQGFVSKSADAAAIGQSVLAALRGDLVTPPGLATNGAEASDAAALDVARRISDLTPQQFRVFGMLCSGQLNKQIAAQLDLSETTVKVHRGQVTRKMRAKSLIDLVRMADKLGLSAENA